MSASLHRTGLVAGLSMGLLAAAQASPLPDGWPVTARASAYYQCHFGERGHNRWSVMVWADALHRVVALSSPRADEPVPPWTRRQGQAADFNALFRTVAFETGDRALVADRSGRGLAMRVQDRLGPCVRSVEE